MYGTNLLDSGTEDGLEIYVCDACGLTVKEDDLPYESMECPHSHCDGTAWLVPFH